MRFLAVLEADKAERDENQSCADRELDLGAFVAKREAAPKEGWGAGVSRRRSEGVFGAGVLAFGGGVAWLGANLGAAGRDEELESAAATFEGVFGAGVLAFGGGVVAWRQLGSGRKG